MIEQICQEIYEDYKNNNFTSSDCFCVAIGNLYCLKYNIQDVVSFVDNNRLNIVIKLDENSNYKFNSYAI